jgi:FkbM family methyltransferase
MLATLNEKFLLVSTKNKLILVRFLSLITQKILQSFGKQTSSLIATRKGINWELNLNEAIDFNIYLTSQYEIELARKMNEHILPGSIIIDIGANIGGHTLPLSKIVDAHGHVYAIEPTDFAFAKLQKNLALNPLLNSRVTPIKVFLNDGSSNRPERVSASWSIDQKINIKERNQLDMGFGKSIENANTMSLDQLVHELNLERLDAIKIDVDGYEVEVLRGAKHTIEKFSPLIFIEFSPIHYEALSTTFQEQVEILVNHGYTFEDVLGNELPNSANELINYIPRGTLINVFAYKKSISTIKKQQNETRLQELKKRLSDYMASQRESWSYLKVIKLGYASKKLYAIYMLETYHYTFHNSRNQAAVAARKDEMDINYMKFCLHHAEEEAGHEMMAFSDIKRLGYSLTKDKLPQPLPATQELIHYIYDIAENANPLARLGYSFWAERVYSYISPLLKLMKVAVGIPNKSMSFFNEHSDIDAKHAKEVDEAIIRYAKTDDDWKAIEECMIGTLDRTIRMTHEVLAEYDKLRDGKTTRYDFLFEEKK